MWLESIIMPVWLILFSLICFSPFISGPEARTRAKCEQLVRLKWTRCADGLLANRLMTVMSSQNNYAILFCRPTNYELLRWLVETPSRDFEHYRMTDDSRQCIIWHFHVWWKCRMIGIARWRFNLFECRRRMLQRHLSSVNCRMTNYELLRWLVETPSRDVEHYHMFTASRSPGVTL